VVTIEEAQGNKELMDIFISENMGLVRKAIDNLHIPPIEDYIQEGAIGLIKAAKRFDISYGFTFSTFAIPKIIGQIHQYRRDYGITSITGTKIPRSIKDIYYKSLRLEHMDDEEICKELNITMVDLSEARLAMGYCGSLDFELPENRNGESGALVHDIIASTENTEEEAMDKIFKNEIIDCLFQHLNDEHTEILQLHLQGRKQQDIEKLVGVSQVQVSRILKKIINLGKQIVEGGIKLKITDEQLLNECITLGTSEEAIKIIADKYDMTPGSVKNKMCIKGIYKKLNKEKKPTIIPHENKMEVSFANPDVQVIHEHKESEAVKQREEKHTSTLKPKVWGGKENTYSFQSNMLIIENNDGKVIVEDIKAMIQELQELADKKEAV
jgi:RNA polymerase sporulation-specific sigma factor